MTAATELTKDEAPRAAKCCPCCGRAAGQFHANGCDALAMKFRAAMGLHEDVRIYANVLPESLVLGELIAVTNEPIRVISSGAVLTAKIQDRPSFEVDFLSGDPVHHEAAE